MRILFLQAKRDAKRVVLIRKASRSDTKSCCSFHFIHKIPFIRCIFVLRNTLFRCSALLHTAHCALLHSSSVFFLPSDQQLAFDGNELHLCPVHLRLIHLKEQRCHIYEDVPFFRRHGICAGDGPVLHRLKMFTKHCRAPAFFIVLMMKLAAGRFPQFFHVTLAGYDLDQIAVLCQNPVEFFIVC